MIKEIQGSEMQTRWVPVVILYPLMALGSYINVLPHIKRDSIFMDSLIKGGSFGLAIYSTYELTNLSIIDKWRVKVAIMDSLWGTFLLFASTYLTMLVSYKFFKKDEAKNEG
mmetsp:Transcript_27152/g.24015  ORF Transcript_27152/g.24015 Transcript_27152/m.24015 type:complete len:112 (+) Transcript_27152:129-464(+)